MSMPGGHPPHPNRRPETRAMTYGRLGSTERYAPKRIGCPVASRTDIQRSPCGSTWLRLLTASAIGMCTKRRRHRCLTRRSRPPRHRAAPAQLLRQRPRRRIHCPAPGAARDEAGRHPRRAGTGPPGMSTTSASLRASAAPVHVSTRASPHRAGTTDTPGGGRRSLRRPGGSLHVSRRTEWRLRTGCPAP